MNKLTSVTFFVFRRLSHCGYNLTNCTRFRSLSHVLDNVMTFFSHSKVSSSHVVDRRGSIAELKISHLVGGERVLEQLVKERRGKIDTFSFFLLLLLLLSDVLIPQFSLEGFFKKRRNIDFRIFSRLLLWRRCLVSARDLLRAARGVEIKL